MRSSGGCATPRKSYSNPLLGANFGSKPYFHRLSDTQGNQQIFYFHSFWLPYFFSHSVMIVEQPPTGFRTIWQPVFAHYCTERLQVVDIFGVWDASGA